MHAVNAILMYYEHGGQAGQTYSNQSRKLWHDDGIRQDSSVSTFDAFASDW